MIAKSLGNSDSLEGIPEKKACLQDFSGLSINLIKGGGGSEISIDYY